MKLFSNLMMATALIAATGVVAGTARAEPPAYELACKPSASMSATVRGNGVVQLRFRSGATPSNPRAGECVWMDRVLNDEEPTLIQADGDFGRELIDDLLSGHRFSISVYNDGAGHMVVAAGG